MLAIDGNNLHKVSEALQNWQNLRYHLKSFFFLQLSINGLEFIQKSGDPKIVSPKTFFCKNCILLKQEIEPFC